LAHAQTDSLTIAMVTYRGLTDAEKGFMDHFRDKKLPVRFVLRDCNNDQQQLPRIKAEMLALKPALLYSFGTSVAMAFGGPYDQPDISQAAGIPLVFNIVADPVGARLVRNLASPGRNMTGVSHIVPVPVQLKAIRSVLPCTTIGVLYNPLEKNSVLMVGQLESLQDSEKIKVVKVALSPPKNNSAPVDAAVAVEHLQRQGATLIYLPSDSYIISRAKEINDQAKVRRLPVFSATEEPILKSGALMGVVCRYYNAGLFAGYKAEQVLFQKKRAQDIPVETLARFSFIINMKTAKEIGFIPPIMALKFAEVVME
jgi:putative ABC transport system substrate-binding protein